MVLTPPQDKRPSQARRLTRAALLTAIALTIFLAEAQLPPPVPIPGIKLGLANIVPVYAMFVLGPGTPCSSSSPGSFWARCFQAR